MLSSSWRSRRALACAAAAALALACGGDSTAPATVAKVTINGAPSAPTLVGTSFQLSAVAADDRGAELTGRQITWSSSDESVATVTSTGSVTGAGPGEATITASAGGKSGSADVEFRVGGALGTDGGTIAVLGGAVSLAVPIGGLTQPSVILFQSMPAAPPDVRLADNNAYEISPGALTFAKPAGLSLKYDRARLPSGLSERTLLLGMLSGNVWTPVAGSGVDPSRLVVVGSITRGGIYAILSANVDHIALLGAPAAGRLYIGQSAQLSAVAYDAANNTLAGRPVTWVSSDPNALTVSGSGRITAVTPGTATITATIEGKTASTTIQSQLVPISTIAVTPANVALYVGGQSRLTVTLEDSAGGTLIGRTVTWSSSDEQKATVDATGNVTAVSGGTVTITASAEGKSATAHVAALPRVVADWSQAAEWTTFQGNASHTGYVAAAVDPLVFRELWVKSPFGTDPLNPVTAGGGNVLVSLSSFGGHMLASLDAATGAAKWSYDFGSVSSVDPPAYDNGTAYVQTGGQGDSFLWGFDANTGAIRFRSAYGNQWYRYYAPTIVGQTAYIAGGYYGGMYAYDATDGARKWFAELNQYDLFTPAVRDGHVYAYTGSNAPKLTVVNASTGVLEYEIPDPHFEWNGWSMNVAPTLGDADDLLATQNGRLISFDLAGRRIKWEQKAAFTGNVTVAGGMLYVVNGGQIEARRESDGSLAWLWIAPDGAITAPAIVTKNLVFVSTAANTYALDLESQAMVWSYRGGGQLALSKDGVLYIAQQSGKLAAIKVR